MFPLSATGEVKTTQRTATLIPELARQLATHQPSRIVVSSNSVRFRGGLLRAVLSTNLLVPISSGEVTVTKAAGAAVLTYSLTFWEVVLAATVVSLFLAIRSPAELSSAPLTFAGVWLVLVGGNYVIAATRFRAFLRRVASGAA